MAFRPPQSFGSRNQEPLSPLDYEIASERADTLGRNGRKVEERLAALDAWQEGKGDREDLVYAAADAVWSFFIHREICGLRNGRDVIARYRIPGEVLARLGAKRS